MRAEPIKNSQEVILIKQEVFEKLPLLDSIVFDVDGVLLDVSQTFRVVICETVNFFAEKVLKWDVDTPLLTPPETELFKRAGGFNNDWDLTQAVVLFYIHKSIVHGVKKASELRRLSPSLEEFTTDVAQRGGGLHNTETYILSQCNPQMRKELARLWKRRLVVQIFQELYGGVRWCPELYGFKPQFIEVEGMVEKEKVLIDPSKIPPRIKKLGVLTGRTRAETELALRRMGLKDLIPERHCVTDDDGVRKPDPRALWLVLGRMEARWGIYVGDALDDLRTVQAYKEWAQSHDPVAFCCMTLTGMMGEKNKPLFLEQSADIIAPNVNALLDYLSAVLS